MIPGGTSAPYQRNIKISSNRTAPGRNLLIPGKLLIPEFFGDRHTVLAGIAQHFINRKSTLHQQTIKSVPIPSIHLFSVSSL